MATDIIWNATDDITRALQNSAKGRWRITEPAVRVGAGAFNLTLFLDFYRRRVPEKERLQVVEKILPALRWRNTFDVARDQTTTLRFDQSRFDRGHRESGSFVERMHRKPFHKPQRVQHEFERQVARSDLMLFLHRRAAERFIHVRSRMFVTHLAHDFLRKRQLRMRARTNAEIVAKAPVVQVVLALPMRLRIGRHLVALIAR